jgi:hypothetical protein
VRRARGCRDTVRPLSEGLDDTRGLVEGSAITSVKAEGKRQQVEVVDSEMIRVSRPMLRSLVSWR